MALQTDVLVAGGGPCGLMLALELGRRGVRCLVVETKPDTAFNPQANATQARTMEHFRRLGFADEIRALRVARRPPDRHRLLHAFHGARAGTDLPADRGRGDRQDQDADGLLECGGAAASRLAEIRRAGVAPPRAGLRDRRPALWLVAGRTSTTVATKCAPRSARPMAGRASPCGLDTWWAPMARAVRCGASSASNGAA